MGNTANQTRCTETSLTRVREEVEKLEYCLEASWEPYNTPTCILDVINSLSLSQNFSELTHVEN